MCGGGSYEALLRVAHLQWWKREVWVCQIFVRGTTVPTIIAEQAVGKIIIQEKGVGCRDRLEYV